MAGILVVDDELSMREFLKILLEKEGHRVTTAAEGKSALALAEKAGQVINAAEDIPKSFVVCSGAGGERVYLSQMAAATLLRRSEAGIM